MSRILWIATGLSPDVTGIERVILALAEELQRRCVVEYREISVLVDSNASWPNQLRESGASVIPATRGRWERTRVDRETCLVHNFGGGLFPRPTAGSKPTLMYSVYDWGPFRDPSMPAGARAAWEQATSRGIRRADLVHFLNEHLANSVPRWIPAPRRSIVAYPVSSLARLPPSWRLADPASPPHAIFVWAVSARKRVDLITEMAKTTQSHVVLIGPGTESLNYPPWVLGRGRLGDSELSRAMDQSRALLLVSSYEGFGIPILEAATRGIVSVVSPEVEATLPRSLSALVEVVSADSPADFADGIRRAGLRRGLVRFDPEGLMAPLVDAYAEVLGTP